MAFYDLAPYHDAAIAIITQERHKQVEKWGNQVDHSDLYWLGILMEEVGELSRELITVGITEERIHEKLIQVAAVGMAWLEAHIERLFNTTVPNPLYHVDGIED